jgi:hypothetical protein
LKRILLEEKNFDKIRKLEDKDEDYRNDPMIKEEGIYIFGGIDNNCVINDNLYVLKIG